MDTNDLMENVRSFFIGQYKGVENSSSFICFEPLGSMIDPDDFKDENDAISEIKATEQLSILGDRLPQIDTIFFTNTSKLSSVYEELIESAVFSGSKISVEDKTPYISKFSEVKNDTLQKFNEVKKASIATPEGDYLPVYGYPKKWYSPDSPFWVNKSFSATENVKQPPQQPANNLEKPLPIVWRTKIMANPEILKAVETAPPNSTATAESIIVNAGNTSVMNKSNALKIGGLRFSQPLRMAREADPVLARAATFEPVEEKPKTAINNLSVLKRINFADRIKLTNHILQQDTAPVEPVHSNGFSMSFQYCIVYLDRPWFDTSLFHYANVWYSLSLGENYFSTGAKDQSNTGVLKCIPTAMILIKDLKITAAWTAEDKEMANNSVGLGIFNISGSTINSNNELVNPGMQIVGWVCDVLPRLPIMNDPNIIP